MKRTCLLLILVLSLLLSACSQNQTEQFIRVTLPATETTSPQAPTAQKTELPKLVVPTPTEATMPDAPFGCTVVSPQPTPGPTQESLFPAVSDADWVKGPADASITIIEYSDFQ